MGGSFKKRGSKYELVVYDGYTRDGKQRRYTKTVEAKNESEAKRELLRFQADKLFGQSKTSTDNDRTLSEFFPYWMENYVSRKKLSNKHIERSTELFRSRIEPAFGNCLLSEISPLMLNRFINDLKRPGMRRDGKAGLLSDRTVEMHYKLLSTMFKSAVKWRMMPNNPCFEIEAPYVRYDPANRDIYDFDELGALLQAIDDDHSIKLKYKLIVHLILQTSCRRGEILGLSWNSVNFDTCTINVIQASEYIVGKPIGTKSTKTGVLSEKTFDPEVRDMLLRLKEEEDQRRKKLKTRWKESGRVFTQLDGSPMHVNSYFTWLSKFAKQHGLKAGGPHCLRHTSGTHKLYSGVPLLDVQNDLDHASITTTNLYLHKLRSTSGRSSEIMAAHINTLRKKKIQENQEQ